MKVGVILLNWNTADLTMECLESLQAGSVAPWSVIVVDNGSMDGSVERMRERFPDLEIIENGENEGFSAANNVGIRRLLDDGADVVWILNNDTTVDVTCLEQLVKGLKDHEAAGAVSGKILFADEPSRVWYAGGAVSMRTFRNKHFGMGRLDRESLNASKQVSFLSGCCMLVRRSVLEQVGGFNESYFAYYEDVEWCVRMAVHGVAMRYVPEAVLWHKVSVSTKRNTLKGEGGQVSAWAHYLDARNRLWTIRLHARGPLNRFLAMTSYFAFKLKILLGLSLRGRRSKIDNMCRGIRDGLRPDLPSRSWSL